MNPFSNKASSYDKHSFIQKEVNNRLLSRLDLIKHDKLNVLEIGSGTGYLSQDLQQKHPYVNIISMDLSYEMALVHKIKNDNAKCVVGNAENPPFQLSTFDTLLSSLTLHWCNIDPNLFDKFSNLLTPNGLLLFSVAGPDTFKEFKKCPPDIYEKLRFNEYLDMHHYGDFLLQSDFRDPVMDNEQITIEFSKFSQLLDSIRLTGTNITDSTNRAHITKAEYNIIKSCLYNDASNSFELTYDIIFGYALKPAKTLDKSGKFIKIKEIKK